MNINETKHRLMARASRECADTYAWYTEHESAGLMLRVAIILESEAPSANTYRAAVKFSDDAAVECSSPSVRKITLHHRNQLVAAFAALSKEERREFA